MKSKKTYRLQYLLFILILAFAYLHPTNCKAQVKAIHIGEKIPNTEIKKIVNYKSSNASIADFKGKLLILDFWATYCAPCVKMFPRMDSLTKLFKDKVQFLSVTKESEKKVTTFLAHMFNVRHLKPISVVEDTVLSAYFRYSGIPYYVWINTNGEVIATTGSEDVNEQNIKAVLAGKPTSFVNRNDLRRRMVDWEKSLFVLSHNYTLKNKLAKREEIPRDSIISYSVAGKHVDHAGGQMWFDQQHFGAYNLSTDLLYRWFYDVGYYDSPVPGAFDPRSRHEFDIKDQKLLNKITIVPGSIKAGSKQMEDWGKANGVSYEIVFPKNATWREKMDMIKQDLYRYFEKPMGFKAYVEKRIDSNVNVLRRVDSTINLSTNGKKAEEHHDMYSYSQTNMPLTHLIDVLNSYFFQTRKTSFINKTGILGTVDLSLNCDMTNIDSINIALSKYGLRFSIEPVEIDVLIFSDATVTKN